MQNSVFIDGVFHPDYFKLIQEHVLYLYRNREAILDSDLGKMVGCDFHRDAEKYAMQKFDLIDALMVKLIPQLNEMSGYSLLPKNHYLRIHTPESKGWPMGYHVDHCGNDLNMTINIYNEEVNKDWEISVADYEANVSSYKTTENQGVVYDGMYPHWRGPFPGGEYIQLFLHYTREDNPHVDWCRWNSPKVWGVVSDVSPHMGRATLNPFADHDRVEEMLDELRKTRLIYNLADLA
jgi:hypothetical protein